MSEVTVEHEGEGSSNESASEDDGPKTDVPKPPHVPSTPADATLDIFKKKLKLDDVIARIEDEEDDSNDRLQLEEDEDSGDRRSKQKRGAYASSDDATDSGESGASRAASPEPQAKPPILSAHAKQGEEDEQVEGGPATSDDGDDSASVAKFLSSSTHTSAPTTRSQPSPAPGWQALGTPKASQSYPRAQTEEEDQLHSSPKPTSDPLFLHSETQSHFPYSQKTIVAHDDEEIVPETELEQDDPPPESPEILPQPVPATPIPTTRDDSDSEDDLSVKRPAKLAHYPRLSEISSQRPFSQSPQPRPSSQPRSLVKPRPSFAKLYNRDDSDEESNTSSDSDAEKQSHIPSSRLAGFKSRK